MGTPLLIFSDLDGSLLDHDTYSYRDARPALAEIRRHSIPLVFVTSKTRPEVEALQRELEIDEPFIVENGGGIFFPPSYASLAIPDAETVGGVRAVALGQSYARIRRFLDDAGPEFGVRGFGDMTAAELSDIAELPLEDAEQAKQRDFSEPFLIEVEEDLIRFADRVHAAGLRITRGGRFHHLVGEGHDKGAAVRRLQRIFRENDLAVRVSAAIGDSPNDLPMLEAVDVAAVMPNPASPGIEVGARDFLVARSPGSRGWNEIVKILLRRYVPAPKA